MINLSEDKEKSLSEAFRVLKNGGRLTIADIVVLKKIPEALRSQAELWAGCIAGALSIDEYQNILRSVGFVDVSIEPVYFYTKDIISSILSSHPDSTKKIANINLDLDLLDGAFAGAQIKGRKEI